MGRVSLPMAQEYRKKAFQAVAQERHEQSGLSHSNIRERGNNYYGLLSDESTSVDRKPPKQSCPQARLLTHGVDPADQVGEGPRRDRRQAPRGHRRGTEEAQEERRRLDRPQW